MANAIGGFAAFVRAIRAAASGQGNGGFRQLEPLFSSAASIDPGSAEADTPIEIGVGGVATPGGGAIGDIAVLPEGVIEGAGGFGSVGIAATTFTFGSSFQGLFGAAQALSILTGGGAMDEVLRIAFTSSQTGGGVTFAEARAGARARAAARRGETFVFGAVGVGTQAPEGSAGSIGSVTPAADIGDLDAVDAAVQQTIRREGGIRGIEMAFAFGEFVRKVLAQPFESLGLSAITRPEGFVGFRTIADVPPLEPQVPAYPVWGQVAGEGAFAHG